MKYLLALATAALLTVMAPTPAMAQTPYPNKQIRLIVPTPAGGPSDAAARLLAQALGKSLGQNFVIDNRPGAGGALAAQALMASAPDGHTLMWTLSSMSGLAVLQKAAPYKSLAELTPVALVGHFTYAMFVHPDLPAKTLAEFVDHARAHPDSISFATGSLGDYLVSTRFLKASGIRGVRVPYRGATQLMPDLIAGRVQLNFGPLASGLPQVREGKLRALAVVAPQRSPLAADVPTLAESGVAAVAGVSLPSWQAIYAPPNTPPEIAERLAHEIALALATPAMRAQLEQLALQVEGSSPSALAAAALRDTQAWRSFASEYDIQPE